MPLFRIHQQLLADTHLMGRLPRCHVLLHRNAQIPWFILVPEVDSSDLLGLPPRLRNQVIKECAVIADCIRRHFHCTKINFAALGNIVPQLHLHVIGRSASDCCWPRPIWGNLDKDTPYVSRELESLRQRLRHDYHLQD